jgi:ribosomal protein S12 methylthiotransferase accessory factor
MAQLLKLLQAGGVNSGAKGSVPAGKSSEGDRLLDWGLAVGSGPDVRLSPGVHPDVVGLFAGLIDLYDPVLKQVVLKDCPMRFCTGLIRLPSPSNTASVEACITIPAGGQGRDPAMAAISCLGEMAERISLFSEGAGDPRIHGRNEELEDLSLGPVLGFSARQERRFADLYPAVQAVLRNDRIDWNGVSDRRLEVTNLRDGRLAQIPAYGVLMGEGEDAGRSVPRVASSSGAAVWSSRDEAAQRALHELVERDAFGRAWYNRLGITRVCPEDWGRILPENLAHYLITRSRFTCVFRVASDFDVHVLAAVSCQQNGLGGCLGVAAAPSAAEAASSSVSEMLQAELSLELSARAYEADRRRGDARMPPGLAVAGTLRLFDELGLDDLPSTDLQALERIYDAGTLERSCHARNIDLWRFDATRADLGVPCVKILSPQLCSWQPRFGKQRLFADGGSLSVAEMESLELEFEKRPFPF